MHANMSCRYCEKRYGEDWDKFKKQTKYRLIPGIY